MKIALFILILVTLGLSNLNFAQDSASASVNDKLITVSGSVVEKKSQTAVLNTLIIRQGVGGKFLDPDGSFAIKMKRSDTLLISATGYSIYKFCYMDSTGESFKLSVELEKLHFELAEHVVMPKRTIHEVHDDLQDVRLVLPERPTQVDALSSPVTAIYAAFSKTERSKRLVAEMEYRDKKEELLIELFKIYVDADIINLSEEGFLDFIYYANVSDAFLRTATEFDLIHFFQQRFKEYRALIRNE